MKAKKSLNWDRIYKQKISPDITVEQFISRIKDSPWEIYKFDIRYCIEKLREDSVKGTQAKSKKAREILKKAGLQAFIPKDASKKKTENAQLKYWENNPFLFIQDVESYKDSMKRYWKRVSKKLTSKDKSRKAINALMEPGREIDEETLKKLTQGERNKDLTHFALSILAERHNINFEKLKKTYYSNQYFVDPTTKKKVRYIERLKPKSKKRGVLFEDLDKMYPAPFGLKLNDYYELLNKRDVAVPDMTYPEFLYEETYKIYSMHYKIID